MVRELATWSTIHHLLTATKGSISTTSVEIQAPIPTPMLPVPSFSSSLTSSRFCKSSRPSYLELSC